MIGDRNFVGLQNASKATRDKIAGTYPLSIDGAACRGTVRNNCGAPGNPAPPAAGLPSSAYDVVKANAGQLGDIVVLGTGYSDLIASPNTPYPPGPDLSPFNKDFDLVMNTLQAEPRVQKVVFLNLRTGDARIPALQVNKYKAINDRLAAIVMAGTFSKLSVADYNGASATWSCGGTNQGCFPNDPVIPGSSTGAVGFADWLKQVVLDPLAATPGNDGEGTVSGSRCAPSAGFGFAPYVYTHDGSGYPDAPPPPQQPDPGRFNAGTPLRLVDTRGSQPMAPNTLRRIQVAGVGNGTTDIPANATAVALNVTATGACGAGFLTVFPCGPVSPPTASNVNYGPGQTVPNAVTVRVGSLGRICVLSSVAQTDLIVDINGYYNDQGAYHTSQDPWRLVDTRPGTPSQDPGKTPVTAGSIRQVSLSGAPGVVLGQTTAVALNVTAVAPASAGFMTVFPGPCGSGNLPNASNLNYGPGQVVPNYVVVKVPNSGLICVFSFATTNLIVDLNAVFSTPAAATLKGTTPTRILDTRPNTPAILAGGAFKARLSPNTPLSVPVVSATGIPGGTSGVLLNTTAVQPSGPGFLTVYPCGSAVPTASNLNYGPGQVVPNLVDVKVGSGGSVCFISNVATDLILDLTGYYS